MDVCMVSGAMVLLALLAHPRKELRNQHVAEADKREQLYWPLESTTRLSQGAEQ
jgi:hypothetical protein